MSGNDRSQDIRDRTFRFACEVTRLALVIAPTPGSRIVIDQLVRAGTSVGANLEEAKAGSSTREFVRLASIALREARETIYWLRICRELKLADNRQLELLVDEGDQIARIVGAIIVKTKLRVGTAWVVFLFCLLRFAF